MNNAPNTSALNGHVALLQLPQWIFLLFQGNGGFSF